jgi:hypothetical protein
MDDAIASLKELLRLYPDKTTSSRAMLGLAEVYLEMGDEDEELNWLERCAGFDKTEATNRNIMDTDSTQSVAIQRLADRFQQRDRWSDALRMWQVWKPSSWCGTCYESMGLGKTQAIVRCQLQLRQYAQAATTALTYLSQRSDQELSATVFVLYAHSGQLDDLHRISQQLRQAFVERLRKSLDEYGMADAPVEEKYISTRHLELLLRLNELAEQGDRKGLLAAVPAAASDGQPDRLPSLWELTVAKMLVKGVERDASVIAGLLKSSDEFQRIPVLALAECDSAEADAMLRDFLDNGVPEGESRVFLQEVAGTLLDQGDQGRFLVERIAYGPRTRGTHVAKTAIQSRKTPKHLANNHDFVRLAANSLPHVMPAIEDDGADDDDA